MEKTGIHGGDIYRNRVCLDFSVNGNPYGIPAGVREAISGSADLCEHYPDIRSEALREAIGSFYGLSPEKILCGNGASELLMAVVHAVRPEKTVIPVPSFYGYERAACASGGEIVYFPMAEEHNFSLTDEEDMRSLIRQLDSGVSLLFLANPNNPTGICIPQGLLAALLSHCRENNIVVVLDECFLEFTPKGEARSCLGKEDIWPNLIVLRSFTKIFALPGVRLGYLSCADPILLDKIERQLPEWNVSIPAQQAGIAALKETDWLAEAVCYVEGEREYLANGLCGLGIRVYPSEADFLLFYTDAPLYRLLLNEGILIRDCSNYRGLREGFFRTAVKKREENTQLLEAIAKTIGEKGEDI